MTIPPYDFFPDGYNTSSCTFTDPRFLAFVGNAPCAGNGVCDGFGTCHCFPGFRGFSDAFNLEGMSCQSKIAVERFLYGLVSVVYFFVWITSIKALRFKYISFRRKYEGVEGMKLARKALSFFPFFVLVPSVLLGYPSFVVLGILRIVDETQGIGVTFAATWLLVQGAAIGFISIQESSLEQFRHLSKGTLQKSQQGKKLYDQFRLVIRVSNAYYLMTKIFYFVMIYFQNRGGPLNQGLHYVIILSHATMVFYLISFFSASRIVYYRVMDISKMVESSSNGPKGGNSDSNSRLAEVLSFMKQTTDTAFKGAFIGSALYLIGTIPQFWAYQTALFPLSCLLAFPANLNHCKTFAHGTRGNGSTQNAASAAGDHTVSDKQRVLTIASSHESNSLYSERNTAGTLGELSMTPTSFDGISPNEMDEDESLENQL